MVFKLKLYSKSKNISDLFLWFGFFFARWSLAFEIREVKSCVLVYRPNLEVFIASLSSFARKNLFTTCTYSEFALNCETNEFLIKFPIFYLEREEILCKSTKTLCFLFIKFEYFEFFTEKN